MNPNEKSERPTDQPHDTPGRDSDVATDAQGSQTPPRQDAPELSAEMEREIDEAMRAMERNSGDAGAPPQAPAGASKAPIRGPRVIQAGREHRTGKVVSVGPSDIFIEFGPKELGVAPREQWPEEELPKAGDDLKVVIDRFDANEQLFVCSRPGAVQKAEWELLEPGQIVEARVTGQNKGGLSLEIAKHDAFMPASLVDTHHVDDLSVFVGEKVQCKVERIDRSGRGRIVLNRRSVIAEQRREQREKLKNEIQPGQAVTGVVRKIMPFGAFVDIGGVDGLVHISDLSHQRVGKVEDVVKEGDEITVQVLKAEWEKNRISLGLKQTQPDPFETAAEQFAPESVTKGTVTRITKFGAFIELTPGVEGLVHISELDWKRVRRVEDVLNVGQSVKVKVLSFDPGKQRISLSVKQTTKPPAGAQGEQARTEEEIRKETPAQRRLREDFKKRKHEEGLKGGGFGEGLGLGDLKI